MNWSAYRFVCSTKYPMNSLVRKSSTYWTTVSKCSIVGPGIPVNDGITGKNGADSHGHSHSFTWAWFAPLVAC